MGGWTSLVGRATACAALLAIVAAGCGDDDGSVIDAAELDSSTPG